MGKNEVIQTFRNLTFLTKVTNILGKNTLYEF